LVLEEVGSSKEIKVEIITNFRVTFGVVVLLSLPLWNDNLLSLQWFFGFKVDEALELLIGKSRALLILWDSSLFEMRKVSFLT
jgi:hypothetical protein